MTRVRAAANWEAVRFFSCKLEQIFSCQGWIRLQTTDELLWGLLRAGEQPPELILRVIKSGICVKEAGERFNVLWVLWEVMKGEADQPMFQNAAHNPPKCLKPHLIVVPTEYMPPADLPCGCQ